jgi:transcriptional regulator with XRE-family HTH domain
MALAQKASASDATVGYLETSQRLPSIGTVARLASALGVSAAWLAYGLEEQHSQGQPAEGADMGARLQSVRAAQGHTKASLARLAELNPGSIAGIENGGQAGVDTIERLAKELRISPAWLAFGVGPQILISRRGGRAARASTNS